MSDLISRQAAIDAIYHHLPTKTMDECRAMLHDVPSAQPETERTMEEFMFGQDMGNPEDGSL